ncbi:hypothetical protein V6N11_081980 [Hibiscus sabdariffa]|uniref:Uncharacterized protein n=2 Tax=Hibiscus sabdariffa TaxID=183260 RepID=A0ABR2AUF0_9ROSI
MCRSRRPRSMWVTPMCDQPMTFLFLILSEYMGRIILSTIGLCFFVLHHTKRRHITFHQLVCLIPIEALFAETHLEYPPKGNVPLHVQPPSLSSEWRLESPLNSLTSRSLSCCLSLKPST